MHNAVIAAVFMSFLLVPAILADTALREKFQGIRNFGRPLTDVAMDAWVPKFHWRRRLRQPVQWIESTELEEFAQLRQLAASAEPQEPGTVAADGPQTQLAQAQAVRLTDTALEVAEPTFARPTSAVAAHAIQPRRFARRRRPVHLMEVAQPAQALQPIQPIHAAQAAPLVHVTRLLVPLPQPLALAPPALPALMSQLTPQALPSQWTWMPTPRALPSSQVDNGAGGEKIVPFRQIRSAMGRLLLFSFEVPGVILRMAREHYRQPSARRMKQPEMLTVRGMAPPW